MESDTWPIDLAHKIIFAVKKIGYQGLKIYGEATETREILIASWSKDYETYDDVIDRISSACWTGIDYFRMWLREDCEPLKFDIVTDLDKITFENNGVYYMEFNGWESHYFIWIIKDDRITYAATYGGVCEITVKDFDKNEYRKRFKKAMMGSIADYDHIFQVESIISEVGFESLGVMKSKRYV